MENNAEVKYHYFLLVRSETNIASPSFGKKWIDSKLCLTREDIEKIENINSSLEMKRLFGSVSQKELMELVNKYDDKGLMFSLDGMKIRARANNLITLYYTSNVEVTDEQFDTYIENISVGEMLNARVKF